MVPSVLQKLFEYSVKKDFVSLATQCIEWSSYSMFIDQLVSDTLHSLNSNLVKVEWLVKKCGRPTFYVIFSHYDNTEFILLMDKLHLLSHTELVLFEKIMDKARFSPQIPFLLTWFITEKHFGPELYFRPIICLFDFTCNVEFLDFLLQYKFYSLSEFDKKTASVWFFHIVLEEQIQCMPWCKDHDLIHHISVVKVYELIKLQKHKSLNWIKENQFPIVID